MEISKSILHAIAPTASNEVVDRYVDPLNKTMARYQISTPLRIAHFLSQLAHESGEFRFTAENLNYSAAGLMATFPSYFNDLKQAANYANKPAEIANIVYGGRMGNNSPGDGWKYKGRGLIGITGKKNYADLSKDISIDFVAKPQLLEGAEFAALSAGWFWNKYGINVMADNDDLLAVTKRINGGTIGLNSRKQYLLKAKEALGI